MKRIALLAMSLVLTSCAGTRQDVRQAYVPTGSGDVKLVLDNYGGMTPEGRSLLESRLAERLGSRLQPTAANDLRVRVSYYRVKPAAARVMVGVMGGQDRITSEVSVVDPQGQILGRTTVDSKNPTAVFTANGLVRGHADAIADFVLGGAGPATAPVQPASQECESCKRIRTPE